MRLTGCTELVWTHAQVCMQGAGAAHGRCLRHLVVHRGSTASAAR